MKNEGQVHRIGLSLFALRTLICLALLLPIICGLSIWLNVHYFFQNRELSNEYAKLQYIIDKNSQNIARLTNLERFLQAHSPGLLNMLVTQSDMSDLDLEGVENLKDLESQAVPSDKKDNTSENPQENQGEVKTTSENVSDSTQETVGKSDNKSDSERPNSENDANKNVLVVDAKNEDTQTNSTQMQADQENDAVDTLQKIDLGYVNLENVKTSYNSANIFISYRLRNTGKNPMVEGVQKYTLINFEDGKFTKIVLNKATDDEFRIKNLKEVSSIIALQGYKIGSRDRLQLEIVNDGEVLFRNVYPISR